ncbi:hypothetical protein SY88_10885 [Clostridiales bacterium PH28_bin88]|nr:hypothetical protein SY88_10885 [Clostridiales bacterium PH28_bin88]
MDYTDFTGPRWVEIDTDAIAHNVRRVKNALQAGTRLMAVVKADAYGCGAPEVARAALAAGADMLGVTTLEEGLELRAGGVTAPVLMFAPLLSQEAGQAVRHRLTPSVSHPGVLPALAAAARERGEVVDIHLKVETGMGRTGLAPEDIVPVALSLRGYPELRLEGVYTHFATAVYADSFVRTQFDRLQAALEDLKEAGIAVPVRHACNSAATFGFPEMQLDMVRVGTLLYGQYPGGGNKGWGLDLKDPWRVKARILHLREAPAGTSVGYGRDHILKKSTRVAVIPLGYADGLTVSPLVRPKNTVDLFKILVKTVAAFWGYGRAEVTVAGRVTPVIGRVGMQLSMVDVSHVPGVKLGDEVEAGLRRLNTNPRLPRVYLRSGQPYLVRTIQGEMSLAEEGVDH